MAAAQRKIIEGHRYPFERKDTILHKDASFSQTDLETRPFLWNHCNPQACQSNCPSILGCINAKFLEKRDHYIFTVCARTIQMPKIKCRGSLPKSSGTHPLGAQKEKTQQLLFCLQHFLIREFFKRLKKQNPDKFPDHPPGTASLNAKLQNSISHAHIP